MSQDESTNDPIKEPDQTMDIDPVTREMRDESLNDSQKKKIKKQLQCIAGFTKNLVRTCCIDNDVIDFILLFHIFSEWQ